ncbi:RNA 2'-phosphotransferase [Hymenobacter defluvii]|uniref:Probable RNA 2'-phosphotransferase n=1 Tax=Hymenobacter defluvii TaxID=2054411 RepID=A0ABS3TBG9_9BACT|nr:RNA 2'-phosphotransferase [Hymenobacter defluvii]MBO3271000.1 RNA 2'-phosphotransferase [Hymenobacter defluvii]
MSKQEYLYQSLVFIRKKQENISKLISYWLRHNPAQAKLEADKFGWIELDALLQALSNKNISLSTDQLINLNRSFKKSRWEIERDVNRIRATHGHSFPVSLDDKIKIPPETLYHGTTTSVLTQVMQDGLLSMNRQFVHLSEDIETATTVAKRHGKPFIIEVDTDPLIKDGWSFYKTNDSVWLTNNIPAKYLFFAPWYRDNDEKGYYVKELKREIGNRKSHILYKHLDDLELVWNTGTCDDALFVNKKTSKYYVVHLTYTTEEQEIDGYPGINIYNSFENWIENGLWIDQQYYYDLDEREYITKYYVIKNKSKGFFKKIWQKLSKNIFSKI